MIFVKKLPLLLLIIFLVIKPSFARDDFPSCYGLLDMQTGEQAANRELFVIVDQTLVFDVESKKRIHAKIHRFVSPGDRITLITFSAYAAERYASMLMTGQLDLPMSDENRRQISIPKLKKFDRCMSKQQRFVHHTIDVKLKEAFDGASIDLPKTELTGSLANFGQNIIAKSKAKKKTVLVISDMLENSDIASFYSRGKVVPINIKNAMSKLKESGRLTDWDGASVYVAGAAYVSNGQYRSEIILQNMKAFWNDFFVASNANLEAWGQPELMSDIK